MVEVLMAFCQHHNYQVHKVAHVTYHSKKMVLLETDLFHGLNSSFSPTTEVFTISV